MTKDIRVYTRPDHSTYFDRYADLDSALFEALATAGVFAPERPNMKMYNGTRGWSLHIKGEWGRTVVTGDFSTFAEVNRFMETVAGK